MSTPHFPSVTFNSTYTDTHTNRKQDDLSYFFLLFPLGYYMTSFQMFQLNICTIFKSSNDENPTPVSS